MTSGRITNGESWEFELYRSTNHIYVEECTEQSTTSKPLLLDSVCLEQGVGVSVAGRMQGFHVVAMVVIYGPRLAKLRENMQKKVESLTHQAFTKRRSVDLTSRLRDFSSSKVTSSLEPLLFVSCSKIGLSDEGLVVRAVTSTTELMYDFLREQLAVIAPLIGACPYAGR